MGFADLSGVTHAGRPRHICHHASFGLSSFEDPSTPEDAIGETGRTSSPRPADNPDRSDQALVEVAHDVGELELGEVRKNQAAA
jgi:hypothetical protein